MKTKKIKTVTGHTALAKALRELGLSDHALDNDVLITTPILAGYPVTPYSYTGGETAYWKGNDNRYFSWPEVSQRKYEIHELIRD